MVRKRNGTTRRFWSDGSSQSIEVENILQSYGLRYSKIPYKAKGHMKGPYLITAAGEFAGMTKIQEYCQYWTRME